MHNQSTHQLRISPQYPCADDRITHRNCSWCQINSNYDPAMMRCLLLRAVSSLICRCNSIGTLHERLSEPVCHSTRQFDASVVYVSSERFPCHSPPSVNVHASFSSLLHSCRRVLIWICRNLILWFRISVAFVSRRRLRISSGGVLISHARRSGQEQPTSVAPTKHSAIGPQRTRRAEPYVINNFFLWR